MNFKLSEISRFIDIPKIDSMTFGVYRAIYFFWLTFYFLFENRIINSYPLFSLTEDPKGLYTLLPREFFIDTVAQNVYPFFILSLILSCIGLFTRSSLITAFVLGSWLIGNNMAAGTLNHQQFPHLLTLLVFAFSNGGQDFSADKIFRKVLSKDKEDQIAFTLLRCILIIIFFSAALSKILNGGVAWYLYGEIQHVFARANLWFLGFSARDLFSELNVLLVEHGWLAKVSALTVFLVELLSPLAFLKKLKWPIILFLAIFQIMATFALYVDFESFLGLYIFWVIPPIRLEVPVWK